MTNNELINETDEARTLALEAIYNGESPEEALYNYGLDEEEIFYLLKEIEEEI